MTNHQNLALSPARSSTGIRFVSLTLAFLTLVGLAAMAYLTESHIVESRDLVIRSYQVRSQLSQLQLEILRSRTSETSYRFMGRQSQAAQVQQESRLAQPTIAVLRNLTADNRRQQQRLSQLEQLLEQGDRERQIDTIVDSMLEEEESLLRQRLHAWDYLFKRNVVMLGLAFTVVTLSLAYNFRRQTAEVALTKKIERQARENAESYRLMSARILELQDLERRRIARELHDSVGQYLAGLKISLNQIEASVPSNQQAAIREAAGLVECAIQEVRTISHLLHPPLLEELGFLSAARWYVDEYGKRSQIRVSLMVDEPVERLPREIEIALFRVLQEALTNVYRHAAAKSVDVRIVCRSGRVLLSVRDDGRGIPEEVLAKFRAGAAPGIGLAGMRERMAEFGGVVRVDASNRGSVVEAAIPTDACALSDRTSAEAIGV